MKKTKWGQVLLVLLCLACVAAYYGYRMLDRLSTDSTPPQITVEEGTLEVSILDPESALLQGITAKDQVDGDVTGSLLVEQTELVDQDGTVRVTYAAFDKSGNVSKTERLVRYTDYVSPRFSLDRALVFDVNNSFDVLKEITVTDTLDGDITHWVRATVLDEYSVYSEGSHDVKFRVTNSLGDTVELVIPVEVYPAGTYAGELTLTDYLVYLDAGDTFNAKDYLDSFTLNGTTVSLRGRVGEGYKLDITGTVDTLKPGVYCVDYLVTCLRDGVSAEKQNWTGFSRLIVVVEE